MPFPILIKNGRSPPFFKILAFPRDIQLDYAAVVNQSLAVAELEQALAIEGSNVIFSKVTALGTFPAPAKPPFQTDKATYLEYTLTENESQGEHPQPPKEH